MYYNLYETFENILKFLSLCWYVTCVDNNIKKIKMLSFQKIKTKTVQGEEVGM